MNFSTITRQNNKYFAKRRKNGTFKKGKWGKELEPNALCFVSCYICNSGQFDEYYKNIPESWRCGDCESVLFKKKLRLKKTNNEAKI